MIVFHLKETATSEFTNLLTTATLH